MAPPSARRSQALTRTIQLNPIPETPQELASLNALLLHHEGMRQQGYRARNFSPDELRRLRRCQRCHKRFKGKRTNSSYDVDEEPHQGDAAQDKRAMRNHHHITRQEQAFRTQMAEDLEWALLICQRRVFIEEAETESQATKKESPKQSTNVVAGYYLCPPYVIPDLECSFDYSKFTTAHQPIHNRREADGTVCYYQSQIQLSTVTGEARWCDAELTEAEYREYLRAHEQRSCIYHPGALIQGKYACCGHHTFSAGCTRASEHTNTQTMQQLQREYKLFETPNLRFHQRQCIVLDCEMGVAETGESELLRVSAVDYFTGETLLDALVFPSAKMLHLNTRYSGVTWKMLYEAKRTRRAILGRDAARRRLWNFVGPETIVIVHGGQGDFSSLRWLHQKVVDTFDCEGRRPKPEKSRSLKNLADVHLGRKIQMKQKGGHDSLEDAQATRDLAHWYVQNLNGPIPEKKKVHH